MYTSFDPTAFKAADDSRKEFESGIKYEKFNKDALKREQDNRAELDRDDSKWRQTECAKIDTEINNHQREIDSLKLKKREIRCTQPSFFGWP